MPKPELLSVQWLSEQMVRIARSEVNNKCLPSVHIDQTVAVTYACAVEEYVRQHHDAAEAHEQEVGPIFRRIVEAQA